MKVYVKEEINRLHDEKEDSYCTSSFKSKDGTDWNLFIIGDGLSGHHGAVASNISVNVIRNYLTKTLSQAPDYPLEKALKEALFNAHRALEKIGTTHTTIDTVLLSSSKLYLAHMGDSRVYFGYNNVLKQITIDEGDYDGPKNYIGQGHIPNNRLDIDSRIDQAVVEYDISLDKPSKILLTTDGLMSRVTDAEIAQIWAGAHGKYHDMSKVLDLFVERIRRPYGRLDELVEDKIKRIVGGIDDFRLNPSDTKAQMIERILNAYVLRESEELVSRIDGNIKYDDTTMILVDMEDSINQRLGELKTVVEVTLPETERQRDGYQREVGIKEAAIARLEVANSSLEGRLADEKEGRRQDKAAYDANIKLKDEEIDRLHGGIIDYEVEKDGLIKKIAELEEEIVKLEKNKGLYNSMKKYLIKFSHYALGIDSDESVKKKDEFEPTEITPNEKIALTLGGYNDGVIEKINQQLSNKEYSPEKQETRAWSNGPKEVLRWIGDFLEK
jgi:protein phosphatase